MKKYRALLVSLFLLIPSIAFAECNWQAKSGEFAVAVQQLKDSNSGKYNALAPELANMNKEVNALLAQNNTDAVCALYDSLMAKMK